MNQQAPPATADSAEAPTSAGSRRTLSTLVLALITLAVFWPTLAGEFVYDDLLLVKDNTLIRSFGNLPQAFARPYWEGLDPDGSGVVGLWRPLTTVALMLGHVLGGGAPLGFHLLSVLVHLAASVCVMNLARRLSGNWLIGLWTGVLFSLHPVHVESVAWISGISDPLAGVFSLLALSSFLAWCRNARQGTPWLTGLWFLLGLLSKESALATLPMMLAVDLFAPRSAEGPANRLRGYLPVIAAFALYCLARMAVFGDITAGFLTVTTQFDVPASRLAALRVELLGGFMGLLFWPAELNLFRPFHPSFPEGDLTLVFASLWSLACIALGVFLIVRKSRPGALAWLLIPVSLLPILVRVSALGVFPLADRYLYLAVFGFAFSVTLFAFKKLPVPVAAGALFVLSAVYGWINVDRAADWANEESLFVKAAEQSPEAPYVAWEQGRVFLTKYKQTRQIPDLEKAHIEYERGMELLASAQSTDPTIFATKKDHLEMNLGLAWCFLFEAELDRFHDYKTPRKIFQSAAEKYPESSNARVGLGIALMMTAEQVDEENRGEIYNQAGVEIRKAIQTSETDEARCAMGQLLLRLGNAEKAVEEFERALELRPDHLAYMLYLVQALELEGEDARVRKILERATALYPDQSEPIRMLGSLAVREHRASDALRWFEIALEKNPDDGYAHLQRGILLAQMEDNREALKAVLRACELAPLEFEPQYNAAVLLLKSDTPDKAREFLMRAYMFRPAEEANGPGSIGDMLSREIRKLDPNNSLVLWQLAEADRRLGADESAIDWINRALKIDPDNGAARYTRALLLAKNEETREIAIADLERAAELLPGNFDIENELGFLLSETERKQDAIAHLLEALKILPQTPLLDHEKAEIHRAISHRLATVQGEIEAEGN